MFNDSLVPNSSSTKRHIYFSLIFEPSIFFSSRYDHYLNYVKETKILFYDNKKSNYCWTWPLDH